MSNKSLSLLAKMLLITTLRFTPTLVGVATQDLRDRTFTADLTDFTRRPS
ncbi:hypothetical protein ACX5I6_20140 [Arthrobacter sp. MMS24-T111]